MLENSSVSDRVSEGQINDMSTHAFAKYDTHGLYESNSAPENTESHGKSACFAYDEFMLFAWPQIESIWTYHVHKKTDVTIG